MTESSNVDTTLYRVQWIDSVTTVGWSDIRDTETGNSVITSYGIIIKEDDVYLTLASDYSDNAVNRVIHIPVKIILKRESIPIA